MQLPSPPPPLDIFVLLLPPGDSQGGGSGAWPAHTLSVCVINSSSPALRAFAHEPDGMGESMNEQDVDDQGGGGGTAISATCFERCPSQPGIVSMVLSQPHVRISWDDGLAQRWKRAPENADSRPDVASIGQVHNSTYATMVAR